MSSDRVDKFCGICNTHIHNLNSCVVFTEYSMHCEQRWYGHCPKSLR